MITIDQAKQLQVGDILVLRADRSLHIPNWNIQFKDDQQVRITTIGGVTPATPNRTVPWIALICVYVDSCTPVVNRTGHLGGQFLAYPLSIIDQVIKANQPKLVGELTDCYTGLFDTNANRTLNDAII